MHVDMRANCKKKYCVMSKVTKEKTPAHSLLSSVSGCMWECSFLHDALLDL
jgi:hypothetical protein